MNEKSAPTAGFRNAAWTSETLPDDCKTVVKPLRTVDNAATNGFLFARGGEKTVVCIMHPREFLATHYPFRTYLLLAARHGPRLRAASATICGSSMKRSSSMWPPPWCSCARRVSRKIVLLGNSGGAGLYCFYNQQSLLAPEKRLARTPGGRQRHLQKPTCRQPTASSWSRRTPAKANSCRTASTPRSPMKAIR